MNAGPTLIRTRRFGDARGWFSETWSEDRFAANGIGCRFVQDNHSRSTAAGTIRGIHYQAPPHAQAKLVRCVRGSVMDYVVDLRRGSPTLGRHLSVRLDAEHGDQLFIPVGFGHGLITIEAATEIEYKVSHRYEPASERGVAWDDPTLGIDWPLPPQGAVLSERDLRWPALAELDALFDYDGSPLAIRVI